MIIPILTLIVNLVTFAFNMVIMKRNARRASELAMMEIMLYRMAIELRIEATRMN